MKNFEIKINYIRFYEDIMIIGWSAKKIGFGQLTIYHNKNKKKEKKEYLIATECMGKDFYKQVLEQAKIFLIDNAEIIE